MAFNAIDELRRAGVVTSTTPAPALDVLGALSEDEVRFVVSLDARMKAAVAPEVVAHNEEGEEDAPCATGFACGVFSRV